MYERFEVTTPPTILADCSVIFRKFSEDIVALDKIPVIRGRRSAGLSDTIQVEQGDPRFASFSSWLEEQWKVVSGEVADWREIDHPSYIEACRRISGDTVIDGYVRTKVAADNGMTDDIRISRTSEKGLFSTVVMRGHEDRGSRFGERSFYELTADDNMLGGWGTNGMDLLSLTSRHLRILARNRGLTFQVMIDTIVFDRSESLTRLAMLGRAWERLEDRSMIQDSA